jgi:hypothetical protein
MAINYCHAWNQVLFTVPDEALSLGFISWNLFMKSKALVLFIMFLVCAQLSNAQHLGFCAHDWYLNHSQERDSHFRERLDAWYGEALREGTVARNEVYEIQVVFHVVWNQDFQNIPDSVFEDQIRVLNEDYRRLNPDAIQTREIFQEVAADAKIEFRLADTDPDGNPSNGITRTYTERSGFALDIFANENSLDEVKRSENGGKDPWDTNRYLNIWVCNIEPSFLGQIFGLAYPPQGLENWPEGSKEPAPEVAGVILHYTTLGSNNPSAGLDDYDLNDGGRTATHEIGHYLGLRHIWGDGFFDGCAVDDGIEDTPNVASAANYSCDFSLNTCFEGEQDLPDMIENFMDYNRDDCVNLFTENQIGVMRWVLENLRPGLIEGQFSGLPGYSEKELLMYPNPASEYFLLPESHEIPGRIRVFDCRGALIFESAIAGSRQVPCADWPDGMYMVQYFDGQRQSFSSGRVLITR